MRNVLIVILGITSVGLLPEKASAEKALTRAECTSSGGMYTVEYNGWTSCMWTDIGVAQNCKTIGCDFVDTRKAPDGGGAKTDSKGSGVAKQGPDGKDLPTTWNGKYTTVVMRDGTGTQTYTVKQGVPIENGQMILAPNGARYHVWDPELARQLEKAGVKAAYANPVTAKNEYALARDREIRVLALKRIAAGEKNVHIPPPTGKPNDTPFTKPGRVIDHRGEKPKASTAGGPPPAAAPGTASAVPAGAPSGATVRDHRHPTSSPPTAPVSTAGHGTAPSPSGAKGMQLQ